MASAAQWASRLFALIVGTLMLSVGIISFLAPNTLSHSLFSFPLTPPAPTALDPRTLITPPPTLYLFASRETSLGLVILTLLFSRQFRSLGLVLICLSVSGATDAYLEVAYGHGSWVEAAKVHVPFAVLGVPSIRVLMGERGR